MRFYPLDSQLIDDYKWGDMSDLPIFKFALREDLKNEKRFLPKQGEPKATGWDVRAAQPNREPLHVRPLEYIKIPLGFRAFCPEGWWYELKPRSSSFAKKSLHALYGTVDETYENELVFACQYIPHFGKFGGLVSEWAVTDYINTNSLDIEFGEAIGQIVPVKRKIMIVDEVSNEEYDALCKTRNAERGIGGFGSTGV